MPTNGALPHDQDSACNYELVLYLCTASRHGTAAAYRRGCRCDLARQDVARYEKRRQLERMQGHTRTLPNIGALRRLHALRALGWPSRELARRIGVDERNISRWSTRQWISRRHHEAVCGVYRELSDSRGPDERARRHAERRGWLSPIWWDDDLIDDPSHDPQAPLFIDDIQFLEIDVIAVERFADGDDTVPLNKAEKACAYNEMLRRKTPRNEVLRRLRISGTTAREFAGQETVGASRLLDQENVVAGRCNNSGAEQGCRPTRLQTETPECPGGRPMPSIAAATNDRFAEVAG